MSRDDGDRAGSRGEAWHESVDGSVGRTVHSVLDETVEPDRHMPTVLDPPAAGELADDERRFLDQVETFIRRGRDLSTWFSERFPDGFRDRFVLSRSFDRPESSFGFFGEARVDGSAMRVMGNYQRMIYDDPKPYDGVDPSQQGPWVQRQMREFVLRYFMRVSEFREPEVEASTEGATPSSWLRPVSLCRQRSDRQIGFGFSQLYYKTVDGRLGRFAPEDRYTIVDQREIGSRFRWIVVKVKIFDFAFSYLPFGPMGPRFTLPLAEDSFLAISRDFVTDRPPGSDPGREGGTYGIGYAFIKNPVEGILRYGPGDFEAAVELIDFKVDPEGRVRVGMVFVSNRPDEIAHVSLDPASWTLRLAEFACGGRLPAWLRPLEASSRWSPFRYLGFDPVYGGVDVANVLTGGLARRLLCVSRRALEEEFLIKHFEQHYRTVATSLRTWRQVPDWLDTSALPEWARRGM